jgi:lipoprotein NlpI/transglutaminase-like putative cysteine protease
MNTIRSATHALVALAMAAGGLATSGAAFAAGETPAKPTAAAARALPKAPAKPASAPGAKAAEPAGAAGYTIAPPPAWVQPLVAQAMPPELPRAPMQFALIERQNRLEAKSVHRFHRAVRQVNDTAGLQQAAQMEIEFDPSYQRLVLHQVDVIRGGQRVAKLDAALAAKGIKLLHRETQLERQMVDGRMTASIVLDDVRVGDRIDWSYSLVGANPVFGDKFVDLDWSVASNGPTALYQYRLLAPPERNVRHQAGDPSVVVSSQVRDGWRETLFQRRLAPQFHFDPYVPGGAYQRDEIQLSEFADWAEVAQWADKLFAPATQAGPEIKARAAALAAQTADPAERLRLALDLVQTEVRYFGTEIGPNSHQPALAETVLKQRFGDCKDKASLLTALLGAMDISATPLLVSTRYQRQVNTVLPSPLAFDHVIAGAQLDGKTLWLDGTRSLQTGAATTRQSVGLGWGLPAKGGTNALQALPEPQGQLRVVAEDNFRFGVLADDARLESRQTFHGDLAELVRASRASQPAADFDRQMASEYNRMYPTAQADGPSELIEVAGQNALTVVQRFKLKAPWRFPQQRLLTTDFALPALINPLRLPDQNPRTMPLRMGYPGQYRQVVNFQFAEPVFSKPGSSRFEENNAFFRLGVRSDSGADNIRIEADLGLLAEQIEPGDWARYRDALNKVWPRLGNTIQVPALTLAQIDQLKPAFAQLEDDLRRGRIKVVTGAQRDAHVRLVVLGEQLKGNRLSPKLRAETLAARGEQFDHLGRMAEGQKDFDEAVRLDPQSSDAHAGLAVNALMRRADAQAVAAADEALKLAPSDMAPRYTRAFAHYFQRNWAAAQDDFKQILSNRSEVERSYAAVWLYLATRRSGGDGVAAVAPYAPSASKPGWPHAVTQYLVGRASFDQAMAATLEDNKPDAGRLCELYFYAGEKALIEGDARQARVYFTKALDTGVIEFNEYTMARRSLDQLDGR